MARPLIRAGNGGKHAGACGRPDQAAVLARDDSGAASDVLPLSRSAVAIEIGVTEPWRGVVGLDGLVIGLDRFGASAPDKVLAKELGFTPEAVAAKIKEAAKT
jgi:transketolase